MIFDLRPQKQFSLFLYVYDNFAYRNVISGIALTNWIF